MASLVRRDPTLDLWVKPARFVAGVTTIADRVRDAMLSPQPPAPASAEAPDAATSTPPSSPPLLKRLGPYIALARLDRPIGTWLLYLPCAFSLTLAAQHAHLAPTTLAANLALFGVGAVVMRGAGCTINDLWDRDLDARVERTRSRPLASGLVSVPQAVGFLGVQLSVGLAVLLCLNIESIMLGAASLLVVGVYPLMKRITYWPQFILGIAFNWGALLGPVALTSTLLPSISLPLYASTVSWTLLYDTVYAHQDKRDDVRAGIRSSALRLGETWSRPALAVFGAVFVAGTLLAASEAVRFGGAESGTRDGPSKTRDNAGAHDDDGTATWWLGLPSKWDVSLAPWDETRRALLEDHAGVAAACALAALHVAWQVTTVRLHVPADCWRKFVSNRDVGLVVWAGMAYDYVVAWRRRRRVEVDE